MSPAQADRALPMPASPMPVSSEATSTARSGRWSSRSTRRSVSRESVCLVADAARRISCSRSPAACHRGGRPVFREALAFVPDYPGALAGLAGIAVEHGESRPAPPRSIGGPQAGAPVPEFAASLGDTLARLGRPADAERAWLRAERAGAALRSERRPQPPRDGRVRPQPRSKLPLGARPRAPRPRGAAQRRGRPRARLGALQERQVRGGASPCRSVRFGSARSTSMVSTTTA